jgi:hypothetical protein
MATHPNPGQEADRTGSMARQPESDVEGDGNRIRNPYRDRPQGQRDEELDAGVETAPRDAREGGGEEVENDDAIEGEIEGEIELEDDDEDDDLSEDDDSDEGDK